MEEKKTAKGLEGKLAALKGFAGIVPGVTLFVTPPEFKEAFPNNPEMWPRFEIQPPDGLDYNEELNTRVARVVGEENGHQRIEIATGDMRMLKLRRYVKRWTGYRLDPTDPKSPEVECKVENGLLTDDSLRALAPAMQNWLLGQIEDWRSISKEESDALKF